METAVICLSIVVVVETVRVPAPGGLFGSGSAAGRCRAKKKFCCRVRTVMSEAITLPTIVRMAPLIYELSGAARNRAACAISSGVPGRPSGTWASMAWTRSLNLPSAP